MAEYSFNPLNQGNKFQFPKIPKWLEAISAGFNPLNQGNKFQLSYLHLPEL